MNETAQGISLTITRTLTAAVERVFAAWTDPALLSRWMAPGEMRVTEAIADATVGGKYRIVMLGKDGEEHVTGGVYREIVPNRRIVKTWQWQTSQVETLVTVDFRAIDAETTELTVTHERFVEIHARDMHEQGWGGCLAKLVRMFESR